MPTGYTAPVEDGEITDLKDFAQTCARAFGVAIEQRDEPSENPVRRLNEENDSDIQYYSKQMQEAMLELRHLNSLNVTERQAEYDAYVAKKNSAAESSKSDFLVKKARYDEMITKVNSWNVSQYNSEFLTNLKDFMLKQLRAGYPYDLSKYHRVAYESPVEYIEGRSQDLNKSIERCLNQISERRKRIQEQNETLDALQQALRDLEL